MQSDRLAEAQVLLVVEEHMRMARQIPDRTQLGQEPVVGHDSADRIVHRHRGRREVLLPEVVLGKGRIDRDVVRSQIVVGGRERIPTPLK